MLQAVARRSSKLIVKSPSPQAWETTSNLRSQYMYTTMEAMPARVEEASKECSQLKAKITSRNITVGDIGVGIVRAIEFYGFYLVGRIIGSRSLSP